MTSLAPSTMFRGLFQRYVGPEDAFLRLARLQFARAGMGAELYADAPSDLEHDLAFLPAPGPLPTVHLARDIDLLTASGQGRVRQFCERFAGRVLGFVVHDRAAMAGQPAKVAAALANAVVPGGPMVFLEYAAGLEPAAFLDLAYGLAGLDQASVCVDIGHVGIRQSRLEIARLHPQLNLAELRARGGADPALVAGVQDAVHAASRDVVELIKQLAAVGKPAHFQLHDGHPLRPGVADHFGFFGRLNVPFDWLGKASLDPLYGPEGLSRVIAAVLENFPPGGASFTLEIHQSPGSRPLDDEEASLFREFRDPATTAKAERLNHWLAALAENHSLAWSYAGGQ
jgi:hypothetical protein